MFLGLEVRVIEGTKSQLGQDINSWLTSPNSEILHGMADTGNRLLLECCDNIKTRKANFRNRRIRRAEKYKN